MTPEELEAIEARVRDAEDAKVVGTYLRQILATTASQGDVPALVTEVKRLRAEVVRMTCAACRAAAEAK